MTIGRSGSSSGSAPPPDLEHVARYHLLLAALYRDRGQPMSALAAEETADLVRRWGRRDRPARTDPRAA